MNILLALALLFHGSIGHHSTIRAVIALDGDVLTGISLPSHGVLCQDTAVYGAPYPGQVALYTLEAGGVVELREQPRIEPRDWVMIAPARWIPLKAVCP